MNEQIERIVQMEGRLSRVEETLARMEAALEDFAAVQEDLQMLDEYLGSSEWHADREADENGLLPSDLQRGVLSEDGIWNVLERYHEIRDRMNEILNQPTE